MFYRNTFLSNKSRVLLVVIVLISTFSSWSQEKTDEEILYARVGFKGGANYSNVIGDLENVSGRTRLHLGVIGEYPVSSSFYIQGELLYSAQGYSVEDEGEEIKIGMNYIALPILAKYYAAPKFSIEAGVQFALLSTLNSDDDTLENDDPFYNSVAEFDAGAAVGAGYWLENGLFFQTRYVYGLTNFSENDQTNRNSVIQFSVGYLFKTKNNRRILQEQ